MVRKLMSGFGSPGFGGADASVLTSGGPRSSPPGSASWQDFSTAPASIQCEPEGAREASPGQPAILKDNAHSASN